MATPKTEQFAEQSFAYLLRCIHAARSASRTGHKELAQSRLVAGQAAFSTLLMEIEGQEPLPGVLDKAG